MEITTVRTPGLGDSTYVIAHAGMGVLVDPQRDVDRFLDVAAAQNLTLRWVLETHVHNDYVSGGREAARRSGAELVLPAGAGVAFDHRPAFHGEDLVDGALAVRPLHTPGHTPEHLSYLILVGDRPLAVFSGGSLVVGSAGRTDLLGTERAHQLAQLQHGSLQRLAALPDGVGLYPTHGEGSFCTSSGAGRTTSTIGEEKASNAVLGYADAREFADDQFAALDPYPSYYAHMGLINRRGPEPMPTVAVPELTPDDVAELGEHVHLVDLRERAAFAAGHLPDSLGVGLADDLAAWVGWLLPFDAPLVLVAVTESEVTEAVTQLARVGFEDVRGWLRGVQGWRAGGRPLASFALIGPTEFTAAFERGEPSQIVDVRSPSEWAHEHLPGSIHHYVPDLLTRKPAGLDAEQPVYLACASGHRAQIAASLLEREGYEPIVLSGAGVSDVLARLGRRGQT